MIRKIIIAVLTLAAVGTFVTDIAKKRSYLHKWPNIKNFEKQYQFSNSNLNFSLYTWGKSSFLLSSTFAASYYFELNDSNSQSKRWQFEFLDFKIDLNRKPHQCWKNCGLIDYAIYTQIPLWIFILVFSAYPSFALVRGVRHWRRRRKGLCIKCGYDLRESPGRCPECGTGVKR